LWPNRTVPVDCPLMEPSIADGRRIELALGWRPTSFVPAAADRGASAAAARWVVRDGERAAFVKVGSTPPAAEWLRTEHLNLEALTGPFLAEVLGWSDDGDRPVLALEDLSDGAWPPPWTPDRIDRVLACLDAVHATRPPERLAPMREDGGADWRRVARDPTPFLGLGLCGPAWLDRALAPLIAAAERARFEGDALLHLDVRSDNLCFRGATTYLIDWNHATVGNATIDLAFWLPSLAAEGGTAPETILPGEPEIVAWVAGFFCARAGEPPIPDAPHVRPLQLAQARTALPWAARALGLPPPVA
jgi:hypothetical protein